MAADRRVLLVEGFADEAVKHLPVVAADEKDGDAVNLVRLNQGNNLKKLVQRAVAAGEEEIGLGRVGESGLPREKIGEVKRGRGEAVGVLHSREFDVEAEGRSARLKGAAIRGLHYSRASARDHGVAEFFRDSSRERARFAGVRVLRSKTRRAEDAH